MLLRVTENVFCTFPYEETAALRGATKIRSRLSCNNLTGAMT